MSKRNAIIEAASELFAQNGYDGTSMEMIAGTAEVSRQTIYNQFESKDALFQALVDHVVGQLVAPLEQVTIAATLRETLVAFAEHALEFVLRPRTLALQRLIGEAMRFPDFGWIAYHSGPARAHETLAAYLNAQARQGHLELGDPLVAAVHFFALVTRDSEIKALFGMETKISRRERKRRAVEGVDVFLRAYGRREQAHITADSKSRAMRRA